MPPTLRRYFAPKRTLLTATIFLGLAGPLLLSTLYTYNLEKEARQRSIEREMQQVADTLAGGMSEPVWNLIPASGRALLDSTLQNPLVASVRVESVAQGDFLSGSAAGAAAVDEALTLRRGIFRNGDRIGEVSIVFDRAAAGGATHGLWREILPAVLIQLTISLLIVYTAIRLIAGIERNQAAREANQRLRASEEKHRLLIENLPDLLYRCDARGRLTFLSPASLPLTGYRPDEAIGRQLADDVFAERRDHDRFIDALVADGKARDFEARLKRRDGSTWWASTNARALLDDAGAFAGVEGVVRDIGASKAAEQQIIQLNEELEEKVALRTRELEEARDEAQNANRIKSEFLANMSHEIRTPMNAILGMIHLALKSDLAARQRSRLEKAYGAAQQLLGILNDILDLSKIEAARLELEECDFLLDDVVAHFVNLTQVKADERGISLSVRVDENVPRALVGDSLRLGQVLINLGSNAVKFSHPGGRVELRIELLEETASDALLACSVHDWGAGMSETQLGELFQPFSQGDSSTTRRYGGSGLGLVICKTIVEMMGGEIRVESRPQRGSIFSFAVRLQKSLGVPGPARAAATAPSTGECLRNARILLADDNEINQELVAGLLCDAEVQVTAVHDGREALAAIDTGRFDAILMDCQMPVMDGYEATRRIRAQRRHADLPIIALTANALKGDREKALGAGMNDHIAKPIDPDVMLDTLARWIARG